MSICTLNVKDHLYKIDDERVPSVTQILADLSIFSRLDPAVIAAAAEDGRLVHRAVELFNRGDLDEDSLHASLVGYVTAWKRFVHDFQFHAILIEQIVWSDRWKFAGTLDVYGSWKPLRLRRAALVDVKSGLKDLCHGPQTAAYLEAGRERNTVTRHAVDRVVVRLGINGFYEVDEYADPADWSYFQAALHVYRFQERAGLRVTNG